MSVYIQIAVMPLVSAEEVLTSRDLPSLATVYTLDSVLARIQVSLDDLFTKSMVGCIFTSHDKSRELGFEKFMLFPSPPKQ